ncbi:MAG: cysteine-rich CWC family protein [Thermonemataceae bacterium]
MNKHERKPCARCQQLFECKVGSIQLCHCNTIVLNDEEKKYLQTHFDDCLCADCLQFIKSSLSEK